jgi:hypothetical protein
LDESFVDTNPINDSLLLRIYIGQEINASKGVLYKLKNSSVFNVNENITIDLLIKEKLLIAKTPYVIRSIVTLVTTDLGEKKAKKLLENLLQNQFLLEELSEIPKKALGFFLLNLNFSIFEKDRQTLFEDWKDFILNTTKLFDFSQKFCEILHRNKLATLTYDYVSSNGGKILREKYVVPNEVKEYLIKTLDTNPFSVDETYQATLFYAMFKIRKEIIPIAGEDKRRNSYWNLLRTLPFDESTIKQIVEQFQKEGITTEYSAIEKEHFLFAINDFSRYDTKLEKVLSEFINIVLEGGERKVSLVLIPNPSAKPSELLRVHSDLFKIIGNFEMRFRDHLIVEMRNVFTENADEWYEQLKEITLRDAQAPDASTMKTLYDKLQYRRNEDVRNKIWPEDELIYYADISDYKDIILRNWRIFERRFKQINLTKEKFEHGMNELNKVRRKVMHLRDIAPFEANTIRLYIIPSLEEVFS